MINASHIYCCMRIALQHSPMIDLACALLDASCSIELLCCAMVSALAYRLHTFKTGKERLVSGFRFEALQTLLGRTTQQ